MTEDDGGRAGEDVEVDVPAGHPRRWSILAALCMGLLIIVVDNTVLNVALSTIAMELDASTAQLQAIVDAYIVVFAGVLVAAGIFADRFGRRRILLIGLLLFSFASSAAALGFAVWWLVAMRALMGIGAALVLPSTLAILVHVFPSEERARAFSVWFAISSVGLAAGPVLGGLTVTAAGWQGVFLLGVPLAGISAIGIILLVPETRGFTSRTVDMPGITLLAVGLSAFVATIVILGEQRVNALIVILLLVAASSLCAFVWLQRRRRDPMVDFSLYRSRAFAAGSAAVTLASLGGGSVLFVLAQYLQDVTGRSPPEVGFRILPLAMGTVFGSLAGGRAPARVGSRLAIVFGMTIMALGFLCLAIASGLGSYPVLATGLTLAGVGVGFAGPGATSAVLGAVPADRAGMGAAVNDTHQQLGVALGVAGIGSLLATTYRAALPTVVPPAARGSLATTIDWAERNPAMASLADAARDAFTTATVVAMLVVAACAVAGASIALLAFPDDRPRYEPSS